MKQFGRIFKFLCAAGVFAVSGCATKLPELAQTDVPESWQGPVVENAQVWPNLDWWNNFNSEELSAIIGQVRASNLDLANNRRNLRAAQLTLTNAGFDLWPTPTLTIGASSNRNDVLDDGIDASTTHNNSLSAGLSYNNILSKPTNYDGATAQYDSNVASAVDTVLNTLGTASSAYFQILLIRDKVVAAQQNLDNAEAIARIAQAKVDAGTATPIDALQQRIAVERQRNNIRNLRQSELSARASLAVLTGQGVQNFDVSGDTLEVIDVPVVQPGLPSDLLRRRPDLVQAEANLRRNRANVDLARLAFLPNISLTASGSATSASLSDILSSPTKTVGATASVVETILDNGRRNRDTEQARINLENALANYRKSALSAFNEVEITLSNIALLEALSTVAAEDLSRAEEAFRLAQVRYREGVADYQTVLTAQNTLYDSRNNYLDNKLQRLNSIVNFYEALGGGWQEGDDAVLVEVMK